jgi:hypothetical protein
MGTVRHNEVVIPLPPGWEDTTRVAVSGPLDGDFRPNVVVSKDTPVGDGTIEQFAMRQLPQLHSILPGLVVVEQRSVTLGSLNGYLLVYEFFANFVKVKQLQFYVLIGSTVYGFTYSHLPEKFELHRKSIEQMLSLIRIDPLDFEKPSQSEASAVHKFIH